jgi:DinB family protein
MTNEELLVANAVAFWNLALARVDKLFLNLTPKELEQPVAPGKNRLIYIWGHLAAVNDSLLSLMGLGQRLHPELDEVFITAPDRTAVKEISVDEVKKAWSEINARLNAEFAKMTVADWLHKHTAVSDADFAKEPLRNRMAILLTRTAHMAYHMGQAALISKQ